MSNERIDLTQFEGSFGSLLDAVLGGTCTLEDGEGHLHDRMQVILAELNKQLAVQMKSEFDKVKKKKAGQDEFGVILLDEEPEWVWMRTDESNNNIVLRLNQEDGYIINVTQGDTEIIDYELGDGDNYIDIYQNQ